MSRLGDLIRTERVRAKLTPKQLAKKCGVAESYIVAVEKGTKIIADDQARRILKAIGLREQTEADFSLDDIAATVDLATVGSPVAKTVATRPAPKPAPEAELVASTGGRAPSGNKNVPDDEGEKGVGGSIWLDALTSVLKHVPVMNAIMKPSTITCCPSSAARSRAPTRTRCSTTSRPTTACEASASTRASWR